jgi:hypothetical protein
VHAFVSASSSQPWKWDGSHQLSSLSLSIQPTACELLIIDYIISHASMTHHNINVLKLETQEEWWEKKYSK